MKPYADFRSVPSSLPANLAEVALINAKTCAAAGAMSVSWWHEAVRAGLAPAPAIQRPRCTRWRLADVSAFWTEYTRRAAADTDASAAVKSLAVRASSAAQAKRVASAAEGKQ